MVFVFNFRLGQSGFFNHAPHHGLGAAIEQAVGGEFHDLARDLRFGGKRHCGVGIGPIAGDAKAHEFLALHAKPMGRIGAAFLPERDHRGGIAEIRLWLALRAVIVLLDLPFNRQAVTIPARNVIGILAQHLLAARHDVLEDLVERMPDVNVAVGVGGAVVQHEFGPPGGRRTQLAVKVDLFPARQKLRLLLRQAAAHREIRHRQIEGGSVIGAFGGRIWGGRVSHGVPISSQGAAQRAACSVSDYGI